jgi:hypothetical protein
MNCIDPNLTDSPMSPAEDALLGSKYAELGPKWQQIAAFLPRRGKNFLKNDWLAEQWRLQPKPQMRARQQDEMQVGRFKIFDLAFCDEEKQETFWQLVADGIL